MKKLLCFLCLFLWACTEPAQKKEEISQEVSLSSEILVDVMHSMLSPIELEIFLNKIGFKPQNEPLISLSEPISEKNRAFYLGAYSIDFGYLYIKNDKNYLKYYEKIDSLANSLDFKGQNKLSKLLQSDKKNIDSILVIAEGNIVLINNRFNKPNNRFLSSLVFSGAWVEYIYLISTLCEKSPNNKVLKNYLGEQKIALEQLLLVLDIFKQESQIEQLIKEFQKLEPHFKKIKFTPKDTYRLPYVEHEGTTIIITFSDNPKSEKENLENLIRTIQEVRNNLINQSK